MKCYECKREAIPGKRNEIGKPICLVCFKKVRDFLTELMAEKANKPTSRLD